jgi:hypothetical protein
MFSVAQGKCTTKGETAGATSKSAEYSEHRDVTATRMKAWGVYIETYDSGDKIIYNYQLAVAVKDGAPGTGKGTYQIISGTGKLKGIKGSGTCMYSPGADASVAYACTGDYTLAAASK